MRVCKSKLPIFVAVLTVQCSLWAQSDARSTILGRVTDSAGGVIAAATVKADNTATGVHSSATTNASGDYLLPFLIPGPYSLTVEAPGFKRTVRPQVQVRFEEHITIDVTLEIGAVSETVQVSAATPLMDSSTVSMGKVLSNQTVVETPLIAGNATDGLIAASGGVVLEDDRRYFPPYQAAFVVRGPVWRADPRVRAALTALGGSIDAPAAGLHG